MKIKWFNLVFGYGCFLINGLFITCFAAAINSWLLAALGFPILVLSFVAIVVCIKLYIDWEIIDTFCKYEQGGTLIRIVDKTPERITEIKSQVKSNLTEMAKSEVKKNPTIIAFSPSYKHVQKF